MKTVLLGALLAASFLLALAALLKWTDRARAESTPTVPNRVTDSYQIGPYLIYEFRDGLNRTCVMSSRNAVTALSCDWPKGY